MVFTTCACLAVASFNANAATIDVIEVTASGTVIGGGPLDANINRLFNIPDNATVDSFTITLTQLPDSIPGLSLEVARDLNPYYGGAASFIPNPSGTDQAINEVGASVTIDSSGGHLYDSLFGLIPSSGTSFPEAIRVNIFNTGETRYHSAAFTISANGEFSPVPIPAAVWLFVSGLIGLIGMARRNS